MLRSIAIAFGLLLAISLVIVPAWIATHRSDLSTPNDEDLAVQPSDLREGDNGFDDLAAAAGVAEDSTEHDGAAAGARPPSIFLIVIDTLRADRISGPDGASPLPTPAIDGLAERGVRFDRAFAAASWTRPSMAALMTSLYPRQLGLLEVPAEQNERFAAGERRAQASSALPNGATLLAEILQRGGYRTGAFVNQPALGPVNGFDRGIDDWFQPGPDGAVVHSRPGERAASGQGWPSIGNAARTDRQLVASFDVWLSEQPPDTPLFAWLHLLHPHRPYVPTRAARRRVGALRDGASSRIFDAYDAEVLDVDRFVALALKSIDRHLGLGDVVVLLTSDHGEAFGEHGEHEHGQSLHREVLHVPLVVSAPGWPASRTVERVVRTVDVMPTLLELAGLDVPGDGPVAGRSLRLALEAEDEPRPVFSEGMLYGGSERSLRVGGYKVMHDVQADSWRFYHVDRDPDETRDLASERPELLDRLRSRLEAIEATADAARFAAQGPAVGADDVAALRALGYVEDADQGEAP